MSRAGLKAVAFRLTPTLLLLALFSLGFLGEPENSEWLNSSPLWGAGDPYAWEGQRAIAHPLLIYRGRPDQRGSWPYYGAENRYAHNALGLRDDEVSLPKPPGSVRILNVGDSATWGLNLPSRADGYSDRLEAILNDCADAAPCDGTYDVVNGGTIGYTSLQALQFLRLFGPRLEPDVVTLYIGNNDSFPSGMKDAERIASRASPVQRVLGRNFFYLLLQKGWFELNASRYEKRRQRFLRTMRGESGRDLAPLRDKRVYYEQLARVSPDEYEANLIAFVEEARARGARPILLAIPVNLVWPQRIDPTPRDALAPEGLWIPVVLAERYLARAWSGRAPCASPLLEHPYVCLVSERDLVRFARIEEDDGGRRRPRDAAELIAWLERASRDPRLAESARVRAANNLGVALIAVGRHERARDVLASLTQQARDDAPHPRDRARIHYNLGIAELLAGRPAQARRALEQSRSLWPFAMSPDYAARFARVVREHDVEWIDLPALFEQSDPRTFGSARFSDWVHPDAHGSRIIAESLARLIASEPGAGGATGPRS